MALELRQSMRLTQQLVMTPQLQQAIKLLLLSRLELAEVINQEMLENPVLEEQAELSQEGEAPEPRHSDEEGGVTPKKDEDSYDELDWEKFLDEYIPLDGGYTARGDSEESPGLENTLTKAPNLTEHLLWQLRLSNFTLEEERIGGLIIGNLDEDGYLKVELNHLAQEAELSLLEAEQVLKRVQSFDPIGVAARSLPECLLLQLEHWAPEEKVAQAVVQHHLKELEKRDYKAIARALRVPLTEVQRAVRLIQELEPKPGRPFGEEKVHYIQPDVYVHKVGDEYVILLNEDGLPKLRISPYYRSLLRGEGKSSGAANAYIHEKLRSAMWLIRSIHQRQRTIYRVMESIVKHQREFFEKGVGFLKPMVLRDVAEDIQMHESTVSRVTTSKYAHTPLGIFSLKYFFNSKINRVEGGSVSAETVKDKIRQVIALESPLHPCSDQEIVRRLREYNIDIARRTVTKYREMMGILASGRRRRT